MANIALFSTGVVASLETKLLKREKINAMVEAESLETCLRLLHEAGFAEGKNEHFEKLLQFESAKNVKLLKELSSDQNATDALLLRYDYHNLKALLKAQSTHTPFGQIQDVLYSGGLFDAKVLEVEVMTGGENLRPLMKEVLDTAGQSKNAKTIDVVTDIAMYRDIAAVVKKSASKTVKTYFKTLFDFVNISTFIRNKAAETKDFDGQFIEGGNLPANFFAEQGGKSMEEFFHSLKSAEYKTAAEIAERSLAEHGNLLGYELFYKNLLLQKTWEARDNMHGIEPVFYYFFAKEAEIDNVRLILTCKKNKVDKKMIYQRLRDTYAK